MALPTCARRSACVPDVGSPVATWPLCVSKPPSAQKKIWRRIPSASRTLMSLATCSNWFPRFVRGCNGNGGTTGSPISLSAPWASSAFLVTWLTPRTSVRCKYLVHNLDGFTELPPHWRQHQNIVHVAHEKQPALFQGVIYLGQEKMPPEVD